MIAPVLVLCLGNEVLTDDRVGVVIADHLRQRWGNLDELEIAFAALAGFRLLELMRDRRRILIVDSICTCNGVPGEIHFFELGVLTPSKNLTTSHQISLPVAVELGKQLGMNICEQIDVLAIEAGDIETLSETLTPQVAAAVPAALKRIDDWIRTQLEVRKHVGKRRLANARP